MQDCASKGKSLGLCGQELNCLEEKIELDLPSYQISLTGFILKQEARPSFAHLTNCDLQTYSTCFQIHSIEVIDCLSQKFCIEFAEIHNLAETKEPNQVTNTKNENIEAETGSNSGHVGTNLKDENNLIESKREDLKNDEEVEREEMNNVVKELEEIIQKFKASSDNDMVEQLEKITGELEFVQKSLQKEEGLDGKSEAEKGNHLKGSLDLDLENGAGLGKSSDQENEAIGESPGKEKEDKSLEDGKGKLDEHEVKEEVSQSSVNPSHPADQQGFISSTSTPSASPDSTLKDLNLPSENIENQPSEQSLPHSSSPVSEQSLPHSSSPVLEQSPSHPPSNLKSSTSATDQSSQPDQASLPSPSPSNNDLVESPHLPSTNQPSQSEISSAQTSQTTQTSQTSQSEPNQEPDQTQDLHTQESNQKSSSPDPVDQKSDPTSHTINTENSSNPVQDLSQASKSQSSDPTETKPKPAEGSAPIILAASTTCQEDCESLCSKREDLASCESECLSNICSKDSSSDYSKLIFTSLFFITVVFVIYLFMQNKSLRSAIENGEYGVAIYSSI